MAEPIVAVTPEAAPARLAVTRLQLTNFRSYASAELVVSGRPVVLAGPNGAGKTNVLDALSLLAPGRGLRGAKLSEHIRKGPSAPSEALWAVAAEAVLHRQIFAKVPTSIPLPPASASSVSPSSR